MVGWTTPGWGGIRGTSALETQNHKHNCFHLILMPPRNVAKHTIYWRNILLVEALLAETFTFFPCLMSTVSLALLFVFPQHKVCAGDDIIMISSTLTDLLTILNIPSFLFTKNVASNYCPYSIPQLTSSAMCYLCVCTHHIINRTWWWKV